MNKEKFDHSFGKRIIALRKARGLTQTELGKKVGLSKRMIAYYEGETKYFPAYLVTPFAKALKVTIEEFLGIKKPPFSNTSQAALWRRLKRVESLSKSDQKALLKMIDGLVAKNKSK